MAKFFSREFHQLTPILKSFVYYLFVYYLLKSQSFFSHEFHQLRPILKSFVYYLFVYYLLSQSFFSHEFHQLTPILKSFVYYLFVYYLFVYYLSVYYLLNSIAAALSNSFFNGVICSIKRGKFFLLIGSELGSFSLKAST